LAVEGDTAMDTDLRDALAGIRTSIEALQETIETTRTDLAALIQGLTLMLETQDTQSELLARLLEAAAADTEGDGSLSDTLKKFAVIFNTHTEALVRIGGLLNDLGPSVETAVFRGMQRALDDDDEDDVVRDG
jgi:hypothetical protein